MNCCNIPNTHLFDYIEMFNLYAEWNRAWIEVYLNWYKIYLPQK